MKFYFATGPFLIAPSGAVPAYSPIEQHNPPAIQRDRGATPGSEFPLMVNLRFLRDMQVSRFPFGLYFLRLACFFKRLLQLHLDFRLHANLRSEVSVCASSLYKVCLELASCWLESFRSLRFPHWERSSFNFPSTLDSLLSFCLYCTIDPGFCQAVL